jgi:hypothetical protein
MNLWEIQPQLVALLTASPLLAGVPVMADDGTYPKTPSREASLASKGLCIVVGQVESSGLRGRNANGFVVLDVYVPVLVEENATVNREQTGGTGIVIEDAVLRVVKALVAKPQPGTPTSFKLHQPPFNNLGTVNGLQQMLVNVGCAIPLKTT